MKTGGATLGVVLGVLALCGCEEAADPMEVNDDEWTFVILPDTQYYSERSPHIFAAQTAWIADQVEGKRIQFVLHEGDIVDNEHEDDEWHSAVTALSFIDDLVPYVLVPGNHDLQGEAANRNTRLGEFFPPEKLLPDPTRGGFYQGRVENVFRILYTPSGEVLVVGLEFGPRDEVLDWASAIIERHDLPTIVLTHAYTTPDNTRYTHGHDGENYGNPHNYGVDDGPGRVNDGQEMYDKLVSRHPNISFVFSGHSSGPGRTMSTRRDGSVVHEVMANYQYDDMGGGGFLRIMKVQPSRQQVEVTTYSPYQDEYLTDPTNEFVLDLSKTAMRNRLEGARP